MENKVEWCLNKAKKEGTMHRGLVKTNPDMKKEMVDKIGSLNVEEKEKTITGIREQYQYGVDLRLKDQTYKEMFKLAQEVILKTKEIIEE